MMHSTCVTCGGACWWQDAPTGGWWIHDLHPDDDHDAQGQPEDMEAILERERQEEVPI